MRIIKPKIDIRYSGICAVLFFIPCFIVFITLGISPMEFILLYFVIVIFLVLGLKVLFNYTEFSIAVEVKI